MLVEAQVPIDAPRSAIWAALTEIGGAAQIIRGIENIEIVENPAGGLVGLRWRETRLLFGKPATVEKWITAAAENEFYETRAESDGFVFVTTQRIVEAGGGLALLSSHDSRPQTFLARLQSIPMSLFFKGVVRKAILEDLRDLKAHAEKE